MSAPLSPEPQYADPLDGLIARHGGDILAALRTLHGEYVCLQDHLALAVVAMGHGYTRGWKPGIESECDRQR